MRRVRSRRVPGVVGLVAALLVVMLGVGLGATPASALNHNTYNILRNAEPHQYCLDIMTQDNRTPQMWTCAHPVVGEQLFILVSDQFGYDHIKDRRSGFCLMGFQAFPFWVPGRVLMQPCEFSNPLQSWNLRDTGEIVNVGTTRCLDTVVDDTKGSGVHLVACDNSIPQRWFF